MKKTKLEQGKENYIKAWDRHAGDFYALAFCSDEELSKEVVDCIKRLKAVIPKIADTKTSFNEGL